MNTCKIIALWLITVLCTFNASSQSIIGSIQDKDTKESLPFATVGIQGTSLGTISNENGQFEMLIPENYQSAKLEISFMGYYSQVLEISTIKNPIIIELEPSVLTLQELVIRPLSPEDYIKRVVKNMDKVLAQKPVKSQSYYREKFMENGNYLMLSEGIWNAYHRAFSDTSENQYQLMLYETADNPSEMQFMKENRDKKNAKKERKAKKKGEEFEPSAGLINATFSGPNEIIQMDLKNNLDEFLDSTYFKKFRYSFGTPVSFRDRELLVINFESKGKVENLRSNGKIYIDTKTDAIASVDVDAVAIIPILIEPILFALGISIENPTYKKQARYQLIDGSWYPEYFYINVDLKITKRHLFSKNEKSEFTIEQLFNLNQLDAENPTEIEEKYRYKTDKDPAEQVFNTEDLKWADFSRLTDQK